MSDVFGTSESLRLLRLWGVEPDEIEDICLIPDCMCDGDPHP